MRLADFILQEMDSILSRWDEFAGTLLPVAANMSERALRDHARQILEAVAKDLTTYQTRDAQAEKSMGRAPELMSAPETAAQTHAVLRAKSGFNIMQLAAEYRALRASVLSMWGDTHQTRSADIVDITRFNEAIDQALAESVTYFSAQVDQSRNLLLGMLGHDMRSPLQTIQMTAAYLSALNAGDQVSGAATRLNNSIGRMKALLDDLLDFNRTTLGLGVNISPSEAHMGQLITDEVDQLRAAHPSREIELEIAGDTEGVWDGLRIQQVLANLVVNAIKYGAKDQPIRVIVAGDNDVVRVKVKNYGGPIEHDTRYQMFEPLIRGPDQRKKHDIDGSLGLGLYISKEIAKAHGGDVDVESDESETVFTLTLPRRR